MKPTPRYEIVRNVPGNTRRIEAAASLDEAKARVEQLATISPGRYIVVELHASTPEHSRQKRYAPPAFRRIPQ